MYREASDHERAFVICPSCQAPAEVADETAICARCDTRFAARDAMSLVEQQTSRHLAEVLAPAVAPTRSAHRWVASGAVVAIAVTSGLLFGWIGFAIGFGALGVLLAIAVRPSYPRSI